LTSTLNQEQLSSFTVLLCLWLCKLAMQIFLITVRR